LTSPERTDSAALLAPYRADPARSALLTDFDGTIAPIVIEPAEARALPRAVELLHRLAGRYGRVAVVSGRPAEFLAERLELSDSSSRLVAIGLYGMERALAGGAIETLAGEEWRLSVTAASDAAEVRGPSGLHVERKGLSVTLHWRQAPAAGEAAERLADELATTYGLTARHGKMSVELLPPVGTDKGSVVQELCAGFGNALYAGDDRGDLAAFAALAGLAPEVHGLKIAVDSAEAPRDLLERADLVVNGPEGIVSLLAQLDI
jgi:trehalose 6-phosphate phosphatase